MGDIKNLREYLQSIADAHKERKAKVQAVLTEEVLSTITKKSGEHAVNHLKAHLTTGTNPDEAVVIALQEASRYEQHLIKTLATHADDSFEKKDLFCANENRIMSHVLIKDDNGETVATCVCGRFKKFAQDAVIED